MLQSKTGKTIQSVQRAIDILNCFDENRIELTLSQISNILELNKSTVHGILSTLYNNGYIRQDSGGRYLLGQNLLNKQRYAAPSARALLLNTAKPYMVTISKRYAVTSNLFTLDSGGNSCFLHQEFPANASYAISHVSDSAPCYATATGKLCLAIKDARSLEQYLSETPLTPTSSFTIKDPDTLLRELEDIREKGYSYEREELAEGVSAISAPIYNAEGKLEGTMSVTCIALYLEKNKAHIIPDLTKMTRDIAREAFGAE